jgi:hypothetical protein
MLDSSAAAITGYRQQLRERFASRRVIVVGGPVDRLTPLARDLLDLGADRPLIIGSSIGSAALPTEEEADWMSLEVAATSLLEARRVYENQLFHLPDAARQRLDAWDPERRAIAMGKILLGEVPQVGGRPRYGARPKSWSALEDRTAVDGLWDALGIPHAPFAILPPDEAVLRREGARLDQGLGTVWAPDARDGASSGMDAIRWVRNDRDLRRAMEFFPTRCERLRVTPFLEGIPCSLHGIVTPDGVAVFRPVELLILRNVDESELHYAGTATYWDPPDADRASMREIARRIGEAIAERDGFRGAFAVDGVLTESGFLPTDLEPRISTGLTLLDDALPELPLTLLAIVAQAGESLEYRPEELEGLVVAAADARRAGSAYVVVSRRHQERRSVAVVEQAGAYRPATRDDVPDGEIAVGPSEVGGFVKFVPVAERVPSGAAFAPRAASALAVADRELQAGLGRLQAPRPMR